MTESKARQHHILYRFYDDEDSLLYVGITTNPGRRFEKHDYEKSWWGSVARIDVEHFADRESLLAAERAAVKNEKPVHNIRMADRPLALIWRCSVCDKEVADGDGWLAARYDEFGEVRDARKAWEQRIEATYDGFYPASELLSYPHPAPWRVFHRHCDPSLDSTDYWITVERIRTYPQLVHWTAHLMGKDWLKDTTWDELLEELGEYA
jgi:predicted GIY-YIG superfamily endonuclease